MPHARRPSASLQTPSSHTRRCQSDNLSESMAQTDVKREEAGKDFKPGTTYKGVLRTNLFRLNIRFSALREPPSTGLQPKLPFLTLHLRALCAGCCGDDMTSKVSWVFLYSMFLYTP